MRSVVVQNRHSGAWERYFADLEKRDEKTTERRSVGVLPPFFGEEIRVSLSAASAALIAPSFLLLVNLSLTQRAKNPQNSINSYSALL